MNNLAMGRESDRANDDETRDFLRLLHIAAYLSDVEQYCFRLFFELESDLKSQESFSIDARADQLYCVRTISVMIAAETGMVEVIPQEDWDDMLRTARRSISGRVSSEELDRIHGEAMKASSDKTAT